MFFVAYTRNDVEHASRRPIAFCFNGGPGSSSVLLHLGALGPRRVNLRPDEQPQRPSYRLVENESSLLDEADLVFIDPVSTGYSRAAPGRDPKEFHGVEEDIRSVGKFIYQYSTRWKRWTSPKFIVGESYGAARAVGLAAHLQENRLRVPSFRFTKELLRDEGEIAGRFDARVRGAQRTAAGDRAEYDPSYEAVEGAFAAALNQYVRDALEIEKNLVYEVLPAERIQPWDFGDHENRYLDMAQDLRHLLAEKPFLKVLFAGGYDDLATPYFATRYTVDHLGLDDRLKENIVVSRSKAGHMMYTQGPSRAAPKGDLAEFVASALR